LVAEHVAQEQHGALLRRQALQRSEEASVMLSRAPTRDSGVVVSASSSGHGSSHGMSPAITGG
jgi:hypothetical protein